MSTPTSRIEVVAESELPVVEVVRLQPGDVLVVQSDRVLSEDEFAYLTSSLKPMFPDNEVMVLEDGLRLSVVRRDSH